MDDYLNSLMQDIQHAVAKARYYKQHYKKISQDIYDLKLPVHSYLEHVIEQEMISLQQLSLQLNACQQQFLMTRTLKQATTMEQLENLLLEAHCLYQSMRIPSDSVRNKETVCE